MTELSADRDWVEEGSRIVNSTSWGLGLTQMMAVVGKDSEPRGCGTSPSLQVREVAAHMVHRHWIGTAHWIKAGQDLDSAISWLCHRQSDGVVVVVKHHFCSRSQAHPALQSHCVGAFGHVEWRIGQYIVHHLRDACCPQYQRMLRFKWWGHCNCHPQIFPKSMQDLGGQEVFVFLACRWKRDSHDLDSVILKLQACDQASCSSVHLFFAVWCRILSSASELQVGLPL